jgi:hypothetical protein
VGIVFGSLDGVAAILRVALLMLERRRRSINKNLVFEPKGTMAGGSRTSITEAMIGPVEQEQAKHMSDDPPEWVPPKKKCSKKWKRSGLKFGGLGRERAGTMPQLRHTGATAATVVHPHTQ